MSIRIEKLIEHLQLQPHPEGGFYKETYRSEELLLHPDLEEGRSLLTGIYFLLTEGNFSAFHRIDSDELWYHHEGAACIIHVLHQDGGYSKIQLGSDLESGESFETVIKAGDWFASETTGEYSLVSCAVAPAFDFKNFELANKNKLVLSYPNQFELINRFTRN